MIAKNFNDVLGVEYEEKIFISADFADVGM